MASKYDILGLGCVAVDDLLYVSAYPAADEKTPVRRRDRQCGGLTATALVAAARLGASCAYAGLLGDDELSRFVLAALGQAGVDTQYVRHGTDARPIHSIVVVDESRLTRTIFYDLQGVSGAQPDWPVEEAIRSTKVLFVDHYGIEGMLRATRIARSAGIPVVADFENDSWPGFRDLLAAVDHLIVGQVFAAKLTGLVDPAAAADQLWKADRQAVVVTCGAAGAWYRGPGATTQPVHQRAFPVTTIDTTGCGDVFHGAYAAALARGLDLPERITFASAAAALKATQRGGQAGIPTRRAVETFLKGTA